MIFIVRQDKKDRENENEKIKENFMSPDHKLEIEVGVVLGILAIIGVVCGVIYYRRYMVTSPIYEVLPYYTIGSYPESVIEKYFGKHVTDLN